MALLVALASTSCLAAQETRLSPTLFGSGQPDILEVVKVTGVRELENPAYLPECSNCLSMFLHFVSIFLPRDQLRCQAQLQSRDDDGTGQAAQSQEPQGTSRDPFLLGEHV